MNNGRQLPDDMFVEYLCWLVTHDTEFLAAFSDGIRSETFFSVEVAFLVETAKSFFAKHGEPITIDVLEMILDEKPDTNSFDKPLVLYLYENAPEPVGATRGFLFDYAKDWFRRRLMFMSIDEATEMLENGRVKEAREFLASAAIEAGGMGDTDNGTGYVLGSQNDDLASVFNDDEATRGTATELPALDRMLGGGLRPGELGVVAAPPGQGKSQFLSYVARTAMRQGQSVVFYTLEMDWHLVVARILSSEANIDADKIFLNSRNYLDQINAARGRLIANGGQIRFMQYPSSQATVSTLASHLASARREGSTPELICVDYADLLRPITRSEHRHESIGAVYEELRALSTTSQIPIWTASQINREGSRRGAPGIEHLADSWDKAKISDYIFTLTRDENIQDDLLLRPVKVRNAAAPDPIHLTVDYARSTFVQACR